MLKYNEANESFVLYTHDTEAAISAGLTMSTSIRGAGGERVFYTSDQDKNPVFNPYAALEFYDEADDEARAKLDPLYSDYTQSWGDDDPNEYPCPPGRSYLPYQRAGISYCIARTNSIIGDEPGLGKTIQAIGIANATGARDILIVCPASIRRNWEREIKSWSVIPGCRVHKIVSGKSGVKKNAHYTVVSYDMLRNKGIHKALRGIKWDLCVLDEAHYVKSIDAQRTRAVFGGGAKPKPDKDGVIPYSFYDNGLNKNIKRIVAMTGTPLPNRPRECYTLARGLLWEAIDWLSWEAFTFRYNPSTTFATGHSEERKGRLPELNARLRCSLMIRRLKKDVLPQLPDKRYEMTYIDPNGAVNKVLAKEALIDFDPDNLFNPNFTLDGTPISTLRREMGEAMVPEIAEYVRYQLNVVELPKLILFCHHRSVITELMEMLAEYNPVVHIGGMNDSKKEAVLNGFIHDASIRLWVGQLDTMEGIDGLQSVCSDVVFGEPAWNPGRNEQCVDRTHRIGQHDNVVAHFLLVEGSFNEKVLNTVLHKAVDIHATIDQRIVT